MSENELILRKLLWLKHGCGGNSLYVDDGEMQCSICLIDFKRMDVKLIDKIFYDIGVNKLKQAHKNGEI